jgi:hypothetical protein
MKFNPSIQERPRIIGAAACAILVFIAAPVLAHVELDAPNGGEVLEAGSTFMIRWHDVVNHGPANFDLWYSTTGPGGPWIDIITDHTGGHSYNWTVPDSPSDQVRVRVQQDNTGPDYLDVSDANLAIVQGSEDTTTLEAVRDVTLYEGDGELANGAGSYLFTGRTEARNGAVERRALLAFDIAAAVPAGSTITEASLELTMSKTRAGTQTVELHRVTESWSEGPSDASGEEGGGAAAGASDATWVHREYPDTDWATVGGSYAAAISASLQVDGNGAYTWSSTAELVADAQMWLDDPSGNYGWALVIPNPGTGSAKRFNSREHGTAASRPRLTISYEAAMVAPTAAFSFSPEAPRAGEMVFFFDESLGSPSAWSWDFGDGDSSSDQNPTHVFSSDGVFTVSLTASNDHGSDQASEEIAVLPEGEPELTEQVILPGVANAEGSGESFFVTTVDVHNAGSVTATFRFLWLPRGADNSSPEQSDLITIGPGKVLRFDNVLADIFDADEALGALAVVSDSVNLDVLGRTFNQTENGTFGQSVPGVAEHDLIPAGTRARVLFLTEDPDFRSNLGVVNGVEIPITVEWELFASDGTSLGTGSRNLPPWGNIQINRVLKNHAPIAAAYAHVWTMTSGGAFVCYGSVADELTSDPTTVLPR